MAARRRRRKAKREKAPRFSDPNGLAAWIHRYLTWMAVQNYSPRTVENRRRTLRAFVAWCAERDLSRPEEITKPILERYQRALFYQRKSDGKPLSFRSQHHHLVPLRQLFKWLARENAIPWNPASELELPRLEKRLPKHVLTAREAAVVLSQPNLGDPYGMRDRAILEVFYSTGMRRLELIGLAVTDLDAERGTIIVRQGKGKKDRMLPVGESAIEWTERYLHQVRPELVVPPDDGTLFLSREGGPLSPRTLTALVGHYVDQAQIGKHGACHLFRHTMATLMLENGADIRFIQQMLGHVNLTTTEIYTQVSIKRLQQIHALTHPTARKDVAPRPRPHLDAGAELDAIPATEDELLSSLAAEADEEEADATA
jgi:integrase/recombinase XerD